MLAMISDEIWNDSSKTFLEPSCGNGNFVVAIIQKKIQHGSTVEQAIRTTYGVDILLDNVLECRQRIYDDFLMFVDEPGLLMQTVEENIRHGDFLAPGII